MTTLVERISETVDGRPPEEEIFAPAFPTLWPHMLLPRTQRVEWPYPFTDPSVRYFYFARNGVYALPRLLGLAGQEVLFPAYFHGVELEALLAAGVRLRFYPVREGMRVDPAEVAALIRPETRAVYLTHYLGFPGPVEELQRICRERGLWLIEDCALALLSRLGEQPLGSFGEAAVFCLYKTVPAPNGGAIVLRGQGGDELSAGKSPSLASVVSYAASSMFANLALRGGAAGRWLRRTILACGKAALTAAGTERVATGTPHFNRSQAGIGMSRLSHRVLSAQDFSAIIERRRRNYVRLLGWLRDLTPPVFGELPAGVCPLFYPFKIQDRERVLARLEARGIGAGPFWSTGHPLTPPGLFPEVDELRRTVLWLPCHQDLTEATIDRMAAMVCEVVREVKRSSL